jgi:hypothetical protein
MGRNTEKRANWETLTVEPGILGKIVKTWKIWNTHSRTSNMARKLKNVENETQTLYDMEYVD